MPTPTFFPFSKPWKPTTGKLVVQTCLQTGTEHTPHSTKQILMIFRTIKTGDVAVRSFNIANMINYRSRSINTTSLNNLLEDGQQAQSWLHFEPERFAQLVDHEYATDEFLRALKLLWTDKKLTFHAWIRWVIGQYDTLLDPTEQERLRALL